MTNLRIGIIGFGTVGTGVYKTLAKMDGIEIVARKPIKKLSSPRMIF